MPQVTKLSPKGKTQKIMETIIFDRKLNDFARKYFIKDGKFSNAELSRTILNDIENMKKHICLLLLYYDSVCFNVYGENMLIPFLINLFGEKGLENLLEQGAIRFLLETTSIMHICKPHPGIQPLCTGSMSSDVHSIPEASLDEGFNRCTLPLTRKYKRGISKKILNNFSVHPVGVNSRIVESVNSSYNNNFFGDFGLPAIKELKLLNSEESKKLNHIATQYLDLALISYFKYSSLDNYDLILLNDKQIKQMKNTEKITEYTDKIFQFEKTPNFEELLSIKKITPEQIPEFRKKKNSIKFRKWIASLSQQEIESFDTKEYIDSIDKSKTFWQSGQGRVFKTLTVNTISTILSPATMGASLALGSGISLLDEFYLSSLLSNWNPRFFFNETINPIL